MYICFVILKKRFNVRCGFVIGLDGFFLKGPLIREIHSAIRKDANNQMFPITWVVVRKKTKKSWKWFIKLLIEENIYR